MWSKFKGWHSGLSTIGKVTLWSVTAVLFGTALAGASSTQKTPPLTPPPVVKKQQTIKTVTESADIAFTKKSVDDPNLEQGKTQIKTAGVNGVKTYTYEVVYEDGKEVSKKLIKEEVTTAPVTEVTAIGTYVAPKKISNCDPNYSGACVPIAYDVDCASGSGNGPAYVNGPVYVIGSDIYGLDRDGDGVGCE